MPLRIAAVGDIHVRESVPSGLRELLAKIAPQADVIVLCGDLTDRGLIVEAEMMAEDLRHCPLPLLGVLGNHDFESGQQDEVKRILKQGGLHLLEDGPHEIGEVGFAGAKGFAGGFDKHLLQAWGENAMKAFVRESIDEALQLERDLSKLRTPAKVVVLHYAPIRETVQGEPPEIFPFLGSSRMIGPIDNFGVSLVFHGHAHRGAFEGRTPNGVPVYNVSLPLLRARDSERPYAIITL